jgi:hypothetical protein
MSLTYDNKILKIGKCSTSTFSSDPECSKDPYSIIYDIVFHVTANNDASTLNTELDVRVEIGNTCLKDSLTIAALLVGTSTVVKQN